MPIQTLNQLDPLLQIGLAVGLFLIMIRSVIWVFNSLRGKNHVRENEDRIIQVLEKTNEILQQLVVGQEAIAINQQAMAKEVNEIVTFQRYGRTGMAVPSV